MKELPLDEPSETIIGGADGPLCKRLPDERRYECSECGGYCWLMPTGQKRVERWPSTKILCLVCGIKLIMEDPKAGFATATREEVIADLRGDVERADELLSYADTGLARVLNRQKD